MLGHYIMHCLNHISIPSSPSAMEFRVPTPLFSILYQIDRLLKILYHVSYLELPTTVTI